jgi:integrase
MAVKTPPYLKYRDGRPRWEPGPKLRSLGIKGVDLKHAGQSWMAFEAACQAAALLNAQAHAVTLGHRKADAVGLHAPPAGASLADAAKTLPQSPHCLGAALAAYQASDTFGALRPATQRDYRIKLRRLVDVIGADVPLAAITADHMRALRDRLITDGHTWMAQGVLGASRALFRFAVLELKWLKSSPFDGWATTNAERKRLPLPRARFVTAEEEAALLEACDALRLDGLADAILLGLSTGQRETDILLMSPNQITPDGRVRLKQSKTGATLAVKLTGAMQERLAAMRARAGRTDRLIINSETGKPYVPLHERAAIAKAKTTGQAPAPTTHANHDRYRRFNRHWCQAREAAAVKCPSVATAQFRDLRRTAITRLAMAGCTIPEIAAVSGHTLQSVHTILKTYLVYQTEMGDQAIEKLEAYLQKQAL